MESACIFDCSDKTLAFAEASYLSVNGKFSGHPVKVCKYKSRSHSNVQIDTILIEIVFFSCCKTSQRLLENKTGRCFYR